MVLFVAVCFVVFDLVVWVVCFGGCVCLTAGFFVVCFDCLAIYVCAALFFVG